ncbi:hypothetical protein [Paenibacillus foliorum]|nr:hypothetical protein [Paenibacillus foliorum]
MTVSRTEPIAFFPISTVHRLAFQVIQVQFVESLLQKESYNQLEFLRK